MTLDVAAIDAYLRDVFPARGGVCQLEFVSCEVGVPTWGPRLAPMLRLTLRLVTWDAPLDVVDGVPRERALRDIKEQEVAVARADESADRVRAYLAAYVDVLSRAFAASPTHDRWEVLMPYDLVFADVLALKTAHAQEDFVKAFERPSRLGRFLGTPSSSSSPSLALPPEDAPIPPPAPRTDDDDSAL